MAEINTGLGWAAQDTYLMYNSGQLCTLLFIGGASFPGQPVAKNCKTAADTINNGMLLCRALQQGGEDRYAAAANEAPVLIFGLTDPVDGRLAFYAIAATDDARVAFATTTPNYQQLPPYSSAWTYDSNYHLYYYRINLTAASSYEFGPNVPLFNTVSDALSAVVVSTITVNKPNTGYAVACIVKWKTSTGTVITSPVLISSVTEFTDMVDSSSQYNLAKLNILRDGMRFYMSFLDITSSPGITTALPVIDLAGPNDNPRTLEAVFATVADLDHAAILVLDPPDPYEEEGGDSDPDGGDGEDPDDDPVEEETLPSPSVTGFCTIYVPSQQELGQMASYLWSGSFDVSQVIKLFSNPMDSILGLSAVPVDLVGTPEQIYLGGVALTGITMPKYTGRTSIKVDFGTTTITERWGSYLDYDPYTEFSIYLPFIGIKPLKAEDIMGKTISLMYAIDILSGGCVAYIRPAGGSVLYEWSGQCALQIPVTARNYDNVFQTATSAVIAVGTSIVAPASAPVLSGAVASAAVQAAATKPRIERSGSVNGITGFLGQLRPYILRTIPEAYIPANQNKFIGYPAYINVDLASVKGYNEVDSIHLENVTATGSELEEIESILKGGVIF